MIGGSIDRGHPGFACSAALAAAILAMLAVVGCSSQNLPASESYGSAPRVEVASWYGPGFQGHRTSSGERYNEYAMTAASKTLPLGSHVRVTNPRNGRSVVVRINDRGPYVRGRSLDLSKAAADRLGMRGAGVAPVEVSSLGWAPRMMLPSEIHHAPDSHGGKASFLSHFWRDDPAPPLHRKHRWIHRVRWHRRTRYHRHYDPHRPRMVWNPVGAWIVGAFRGM